MPPWKNVVADLVMFSISHCIKGNIFKCEKFIICHCEKNFEVVNLAWYPQGFFFFLTLRMCETFPTCGLE